MYIKFSKSVIWEAAVYYLRTGGQDRKTSPTDYKTAYSQTYWLTPLKISSAQKAEVG